MIPGLEKVIAGAFEPVTMLVFVAIIANNYLIAPYIELFFGPENSISLQLPPDMWGLLKLGLGGYVVGRSAEKVAKDVFTLLKKDKPNET